jgi:hypothetical protein
MTARSSSVALSIAIAVGLLARTAQADDGASAVVLASGEGSLLEPVRQTATTWLEGHGTRVTDGGLKKKESAKLAKCLVDTPDGCTESLAKLGVDQVWFFDLKSQAGDSGADVDLVLRVFGADGAVIASDRRYCERCRAETLVGQVEKVLAVVAEAVTARTSARTVLRIRTEPSGALVEIDGKAIGTAEPELEYAVLPGPHEITARKDGHEPRTQHVDLGDGEERSVALSLTPIEKIEEPVVVPPVTTKGRGPWPYVIGGGGVAALVTGITFLVMNEPKEEGGVQQYEMRETLVPGAIFTGLGVAAIGVATYLFLRSPGEEQSPTIAPAVGVGGDTVTLGLSGGF